MIVLPPLLLGYQYVPKVGSTSLFAYLYGALYGLAYDPARHPHGGRPVFVQRYFLAGLCPHAQEQANSAAMPGAGYFRFALTRDPVRRFLSMYSNRVIQKCELAAASPYAAALRRAGLPCDPDINYLVRHLDAYLDCHASLHHHARPMMDFLGPDLAVYDRIADLSEIDGVIGEIEAHWHRADLPAPAARAPALTQMQRCGSKLGLEALTADSFERLLDYYRTDYQSLPTLDRRAIEAAYYKARSGYRAPARGAGATLALARG